VLFVNRKTIPLISLLIVGLYSVAITSAAIIVGVKSGDWVEYQVLSTGALDPAHSIAAAKIEVLSVQGAIIQVNIISTYSNGTQVSTRSELNLQTGELIDNFIIPAGLVKNDQFYDAQAKSNVTIAGVEQQTYAGAMRTVVRAMVNTTSNYNTYIWDQATGISVEGISEGSGYTIHSVANATNIWQSQTTGSDLTLVYFAVVIAAVVTVAIVLFARGRRRF
jgi:hypothetical protein